MRFIYKIFLIKIKNFWQKTKFKKKSLKNKKLDFKIYKLKELKMIKKMNMNSLNSNKNLKIIINLKFKT